MMVDVECAMARDASSCRAALHAVVERARALGLEGSVLAAMLPLAVLEASADLARQALALAERVEPSLRYHAEVSWQVARALRAAGRGDEARSVAAAGADWVERVTEDGVDEAFRESFLQRNPVNLGLRALAASA